MHGYGASACASTNCVYFTRMSHWTDELHEILLQVSGAMNRPEQDAHFLARSGVKLDRALFPLLTRIGAAGPIGAVELASLVGRDHSTVSRQTAKLEDLGLIERKRAIDDARMRLLQPTAAGKKMLAAFSRVRRNMMEDHFRNWTTKEREQLLRLLRKMVTQEQNAVGDDIS